MSIEQMKTRVKEMMAASYGNAVANVVADDGQIAGAFFVRAKDAAAIRNVCRSGGYMISFRVAGQHTLARIDGGNPCKGHKITDKSIKESATDGFTYTDLSQSDFSRLRGLVGKPVSREDKHLSAVWKVKPDNTYESVPLADVRRVMADDKELARFYTGDYDMHDLLKKVGGGPLNRVLAGTPDEASAIEAFNLAILNGDPARKTKVNAWVNASQPAKRLATSEYALIRHGAQTSFISYLLGPGETELRADRAATTIPLEDLVNNIDPKICVFAADGRAFILDTVAKIYRYYADNNLLDQIPFYYFFRDLKKLDPNYKRDLVTYAREINAYIANCYG
ncbi:hypothetical protein [Rugamonas aquatica]|uniref:Uncharacterized protein n=1 Tax=Rugamonas aquatica TaxID=2743357 RepID=A0A6A7NBQ2_9BURK|nr:hypothetical protein [Rugamonas aquatica]MQA42481.1 hypothetical protein [Rugamonas aquatica]